MLILILTCLLALGALIWGAAGLVDGCVSAARALRVNPALVGLTVIALGTSLPELVVSAEAAFLGHDGLVIGNIVGSNIANATLVLGAGLLFARSSLSAWPGLGLSLLAVTLLAAWLLFDSELSRLDAIVLLLAAIPIAWLIHRQMGAASSTQPQVAAGSKNRRYLLWIPVTLVVVVVSADFLVDAAAEIAVQLGVDQELIGLTLLALGTSLPEVATSVAAAWQRQAVLIIPNLLGSNFFNLLTVLGISGAISPLQSESEGSSGDLLVLLLATAILVWITARPLSHRAGLWIGAALCLFYLSYLASLVRQAGFW